MSHPFIKFSVLEFENRATDLFNFGNDVKADRPLCAKLQAECTAFDGGRENKEEWASKMLPGHAEKSPAPLINHGRWARSLGAVAACSCRVKETQQQPRWRRPPRVEAQPLMDARWLLLLADRGPLGKAGAQQNTEHPQRHGGKSSFR